MRCLGGYGWRSEGREMEESKCERMSRFEKWRGEWIEGEG